MADTVTIQTIGSWEAEGVTVGQIEGALSELRRHEERAAVRTSVLTLVVVVHDPEAAATALDVVRQLGARHPARTLVLRLDDAGAEQAGAGRGFDASVGVHVIDHDGRAVCFEDVTLAVRGRARHHLDSLVEPFTLPDLPVVVWVPDRLPGTGDPLLDAADRVIVDSRAAPDDRQVLPRLAGLVRRLPVTDLSWVRLAPWRHLLAAVFDDPTHTPFLGSVQGAEVVGRHGPRHLLAGWLASRLRLPRARLHLGPGLGAVRDRRRPAHADLDRQPGRPGTAHPDVADSPRRRA